MKRSKRALPNQIVIILASVVLITVIISISYLIYQKISHTFEINLNSKESLMITIPNSKEFKKDEEGQGWTRYSDNVKKTGSSSDFFIYFTNEQAMSRYFGQMDTEKPLEKVTTAQGDAYYILKVEAKDQFGYGTMYMWRPQVQVKDYLASHMYFYVNNDYSKNETSAVFDEENSYVPTKVCIIDLNQIDKNLYGYLVYAGQRSIGTDIDYCEELDHATMFGVSYKSQ